MNESLREYQRGDYKKCIELANKALSVQSDHAVALNNVCAAHLALKEWDLAIAAAEKALRADPNFKLAENNLKAAKRAKLAPPQVSAVSAGALLNKSLAEYQKSNFHDAIEHAQAAIAIKPDYAAAYNNLCVSFSGLGEWDKAIEAGESAVRLDPSFDLARNNLAFARARKAERQRGAWSVVWVFGTVCSIVACIALAFQAVDDEPVPEDPPKPDVPTSHSGSGDV